MADYSIVHDSGGNLCGIWLRDSNQARNKNIISMLLMKMGAEQFVEAALGGHFRVVPNSCDENGGVFIMFGSAPAPGEDLAPVTEQQKIRGKPDKQCQTISNDISKKICAICGAVVDQDLLQCLSCGKGTFEVHKTYSHDHGSARISQGDSERTTGEGNENIFSQIFSWVKNIKEWMGTKRGASGNLDSLVALAGEGSCPLCGTPMKKDQIGLRCENGHDVVCRNAFFSEYTTPSEAVARELRARGIKVVVLP